VGTG
jgi:hypothetical protein